MLGTLLVCSTAWLAFEPARALEVRCIEASKYKHLFLIFGGDRAKFAEYLQIDKSQLPDPEICRAILVTGRIEPHKRNNPHEDGDFDQLFGAIAANGGWLAAVYLSSPGGTVGTAMRLALLARMFWLKTYAPGGAFFYTPDFFAPADLSDQADQREAVVADLPPDLVTGWRTYVHAMQAHARVELPLRPKARCSSACTYPLVAGVDRHGTAYVHRGRRVRQKEGESRMDDRSMAEIVEILQRSEARMIALYRQMDAGEEIIRLFQSTSTATVSPASMARSPRFLADYLRPICKADVNAPITVNRSRFEQCLAASHERERLRQYTKLCGEACNRETVLRLIRNRIRNLVPGSDQEPPVRR